MFAIMMAVVLLVSAAVVPQAAAQDDTAQVRVIHASPDAPAVDIYVNGEAVSALSNVPFFTASDFLSLPAGDQQIAVAPAGTSVDDAVISATVTLNAGSAYSIAAVGLLENIQAQVYEENLSPTAEGEARVYVYHFSPDAPAVDIRLADGTVLAEGLAFPNKGELNVPADTYDIQVVPSGASEPVVIDLSGTTLEAGTLYSVFATNTLSEITPQLATTSVGSEAAPEAAQPTEEPAPTEAPAATEAPAPTPAPTAQPDAPATLPETAEGSNLPTGVLALAALALVGLGALVLMRRRSTN
jgi:MYXO-CTERM domain-containing protein